jgi:hypothetical protein
MIEGLLWIVGSYGLGAALVHLLHSVHRHSMHHRRKHRKHIYALTVGNNQLHIEWYIRTLSLITWLKGREMEVYIFDDGSTDDTLGIIERLARDSKAAIRIVPPDVSQDAFLREHENDPIVWVRLTSRTEMVNLLAEH